MIGKVDAVYFTKDWSTARGCRIERLVCKEYGVKILDANFLEEPKEELVRTPLTNNEIDAIVEKTKRDIENTSFKFDSNHINIPAYDE